MFGRSVAFRGLTSGLRQSKPLGTRCLSTTPHQLLDAQLERLPAKNLARFGEQGIRFSVLKYHRYSKAIANGLSNGGLAPGDKIVLLLPYSSEHVATQMGAAMTGVTVVGVEGVPTAEGLREILKKSGAQALMYDPVYGRQDMESIVTDVVKFENGMVSPESSLPELKMVFSTGFNRVPGVMRYKEAQIMNPSTPFINNTQVEGFINAEKPNWLETYSATGEAGNKLSFEAVLSKSKSASETLSLTADTSVLLSTKEVSPSTLLLSTLTCLQSCSQLVIPTKYPDAEVAAKLGDAEKCEISIGDVAVANLKQHTV